MIKAALIDMDGVLYDSMPFHTKAWKRLSDELGLNIPIEKFYLYEGMTAEDTINLVAKHDLNRPFSPEECQELYRKKTLYMKEMGNVPVMPGALQTLNFLKSKGIICVLVTGSGQYSLIDSLNKDFPGIFDNNKLVTSYNVTKGKPHPEPYLKGAQLADCKIEDCIAIDNAPLGVKSASTAGAYTIGVTTGPIPAENLLEAGADIVIKSMTACKNYLQTILN